MIFVQKRLRFLLSVLLVGISLVSSCKPVSEEIRQFTVENELCHFTFEYPSYYKTEGPNTDLDYIRPYTHVYLYAPREPIEIIVPSGDDHVETVKSSYVPATIFIHVFVPVTRDGRTWSAKDYAENDVQGNRNWDYFQVFEHSTRVVSGMECEFVYYQSDWIGLFPPSDEPKVEYYKVIYFDYDGLVWSVEASSRMDKNHRVMQDFEHILDTFKILN